MKKLNKTFKMELLRIILDIVLIILLLIFTFFKGYFNKKGENLATKKDIAKITENIEKVKYEYNIGFEKYKIELISELTKKNFEFEIKRNIYDKLILVKSNIVKIERLKQMNKSISNEFDELFKNLTSSTDYIFQNKVFLENLKSETLLFQNEINLMVDKLKKNENYDLSNLNDAIDKYIDSLYK